jgi:putative tryptophan/tyrosine transport system substrate-binding protein
MRPNQLRRRQFIALLGGAAAAWPLGGRAQQPAMPVIGFLSGTSPGAIAHLVATFHQGLKDAGYVEAQSVAIEYRWAQGQYNLLPTLAADLVSRQVAVIAALDQVRTRHQRPDGQNARPHHAADAARHCRRGDRIMRRRDFITLLGGAAITWPLAARAQQGERIRRIGILLPAAADDAGFQAPFGAFLQALALLGWTIGRNVRIDTRWATANAAEIRRHAADLVALAPDVILASGTSTVGPLLQATSTVPIVFSNIGDPVGGGFVDSLARPGGNATGFMSYEYTLSGKWLELLKEIAPGVTRVAVLRDAAVSIGPAQFGVIQAVAPSLRVEANPINLRDAGKINMRDAGEIERAIATFGGSPNGGLIVTASALAVANSDLIVTLAARHKLPAVYNRSVFVTNGGLISYGPDFTDLFRHAAGYVDRILKGEKPADLPVQAPTKYELVINLKTAKALGLDLPASVLARANEVIE